jgi:hypothetical protein
MRIKRLYEISLACAILGIAMMLAVALIGYLCPFFIHGTWSSTRGDIHRFGHWWFVMRPGQVCVEHQEGQFLVSLAHGPKPPVSRPLKVNWALTARNPYDLDHFDNTAHFAGFQYAWNPEQDRGGGGMIVPSYFLLAICVPLLTLLCVALGALRSKAFSDPGARLCEGCGYDVRGSAERCPERGRDLVSGTI